MELPFLDYFINAHQRLFWLHLMAAFAIAVGYMYMSKTPCKHYFGTHIWWHPSARLDYIYFIVVSFIKVAVIVPLVFSSKAAAFEMVELLQTLFGYFSPLEWSRELIVASYTVALFVVSDFTRYWLHRLLHTVPFLWRFHRVHHSAEVLNPFTFYRVHPVENLLFGVRYALSAGVVTGFFIYLFGARIGLLEIAGVNAVVFVFGLLGSNLRHSHLPLRYGDMLEQWLISPYMHQLHHTRAYARYNYGGALAIWDRMFKTLHVTQVKSLAFGSDVRHESIVQMLLEPFVNRLLAKLPDSLST